jgi:tryptophanyl-tRNA synthetase
MQNSTGILGTMLFLGLAANLANAAESKAVQAMAGILMSIQHVPSGADKQALAQITRDEATTADERTVAQALMNVQHTAAAADKPRLEAIVNGAKASGSLKTLATVILGLHHFPSASDKDKLHALTQ